MEVTPCSHYVLPCPQIPVGPCSPYVLPCVQMEVGPYQIRSQFNLFSVVLQLSESCPISH